MQLSRLMNRDGLNEIEANKRINAQKLLEEKIELSDVIVYNSFTIKELKNDILVLYSGYTNTKIKDNLKFLEKK